MGHELTIGATECPKCLAELKAKATPKKSESTNNGKTWLLLSLVGLVVVAVSAVIVVMVFVGTSPQKSASKHGGKTTTTIPAVIHESPMRAASAITQLLNMAGQDRRQLTSALGVVQAAVDAGYCSYETSAAVQQIVSVTNNRTYLIRHLRRVDVSAIRGGAVVKSELLRSWLLSRQIDQDLATWGSVELENSCSINDGNVPAYMMTLPLDSQSTLLKQELVNRWDAIAPQYGQPSSWTSSDI